MEKNNIYDTIIVGCGPAGITAAIYLRRANKSVAIVEREAIGGQMAKSPYIENYPGFVGSGNDLAELMFKPLEQDVDFYFGEVNHVKQKDYGYIVKTDDAVLEAKTIIWATGCEHVRLKVPGEDSQHVHYCATCDGPLYKDKEVVVVGDGNSALQYAIELAGYCKNVTILTLFDKFFGENRLVDRLLRTPNITWLKNWGTTGCEDKGDAIAITGKANDKEYTIITDAVFIAIGQKPHNEVVKDIVKLSDNGYVMASEFTLCAAEGFYAAGDCRLKDGRQVITACGDGAIAALNVIDYLDYKKELL